MNKKVTLCLYYAGLILGTVLINYMIKYHNDYAESIMSGFRNMDRIYSIDGQELFLYLFFRRLKQVFFLFVLYFLVSKKLFLLFFPFYYGLIEGNVLSLFFYSYSLSGVVFCAIIMIPQFLCFVIFEILGWRYLKKKILEKEFSNRNVYLFIIVVAIVLTIIELIINLNVVPKILIYK